MCPELQGRDPCALHHADVLKTWCESISTELVSVEVCQAALEASARRLIHKKKPWACISGPAGVLLLVASRLGWQILDATHMITDQGVQVELDRWGAQEIALEAQRAMRREAKRRL
eukprot:123459-Amphidinium_carterae.1